MKKIIWVLMPILLVSGELKNIFTGIDNSLLVKSSTKRDDVYQKLFQVAKAKKFPSIDIKFSAIRLKDTPKTVFFIPPVLPPTDVIIGTKSNFSGEIGFFYPIFSGYAITSGIKKAKLQLIKQKLTTKNLKRELYLKAVDIYVDIYIITKAIKAENEAILALKKSLQKAKEMYENDLVNLSSLYNIKAKLYDIESNKEGLVAKQRSLSNMLHYLSGYKIDSCNKLDDIKFTKDLKQAILLAYINRSDLLSIKKELKIADKDILIAKSRYYPSIALVGGIKKEGDTLSLNGNDYSNADKSYIGLNLTWNIFDGYAKKAQKEAAFLKKEATMLYLNDYKNLIKTEIENDFLNLDSLVSKLKATKLRLKSQAEYYKLIKGRFDNALSSADELSRAIASFALAKAKVEEVRAKIYKQKVKILLQIGVSFTRKSI